MNRRFLSAGMGTAVALAMLAPAAYATLIGTSSQSSSQGANATQLANAPTATGNTIVLGPAAAGPPSTQTSTNTLMSNQAVGGAGGAGTLISPSGVGPSQLNQQGANSQQGSANGAIGLQGATNTLGSTQIVGGDQSCLTARCVSSVIIGSPTQANQQGVNAGQFADGGVTTGDSITAPTFTFNGLAGPTSQALINVVTNGQLVLG